MRHPTSFMVHYFGFHRHKADEDDEDEDVFHQISLLVQENHTSRVLLLVCVLVQVIKSERENLFWMDKLQLPLMFILFHLTLLL